MQLLARREHSTLELRHKLTARDFEAAIVDGVLAGLRQEGFLSDERFTETYVFSRVSRGFGPLRIRAELRERGVDDALISRFLAPDAANWCRHVAEARRKRFGSGRPRDFAERARQTRFLQQRGFSLEQIKGAFAEED